MPVTTADNLQSSYDVVIAGSGAGGVQTAYTLTMEGVKVLVLEAGRSFDVQTEVAMLQWPSHNVATLRSCVISSSPPMRVRLARLSSLCSAISRLNTQHTG